MKVVFISPSSCTKGPFGYPTQGDRKCLCHYSWLMKFVEAGLCINTIGQKRFTGWTPHNRFLIQSTSVKRRLVYRRYTYPTSVDDERPKWNIYRGVGVVSD